MITTFVFDYGRVLAYPKMGNWFITPNTKKIIGIPNYIRCILNFKKIGVAFKNAYKFLNDNHILHTEQEEYLQFIEFFKIFFKSMNFKKDMTKECQELAHDIVYNDDKVSFYDDVFEIATQELDLVPKECVFIDDSVSNLENAEKVGYNPILMDRNDKIDISKYPLAKNMNDVINITTSTLASGYRLSKKSL